MTRWRLDQLVAARGLAESREKAQRLIRAGQVRWKDRLIDKPAHPCAENDPVEVLEPERFVSRGGHKLEEAFAQFELSVEGLCAADIGASTGGFTDCLLQHGARKVYAVDVGKGQLAWSLRQDERVVVRDGVNARYLERSLFDDPIEFAVVDVSFISLTKILGPVSDVLEPGSRMVTLIKPQFEAGRDQVGKGGVVRDENVRQALIEAIRRFGRDELNLCWEGVCRSPIKGPAGNIEFPACWRTPCNTLE